jgi:hypothetical protein
MFDAHAEAKSRGISIQEMSSHGGRKAHEIIDWVTSPNSGTLYCKTPSYDWHRATPRERKLILGSVFRG